MADVMSEYRRVRMEEARRKVADVVAATVKIFDLSAVEEMYILNDLMADCIRLSRKHNSIPSGRKKSSRG